MKSNNTQRNEMKRNENARLNKFPKSIRTDNDNNDDDNDDAQQLVSGWHTKPFRLLGRGGDDKLTNSYYKFIV